MTDSAITQALIDINETLKSPSLLAIIELSRQTDRVIEAVKLWRYGNTGASHVIEESDKLESLEKQP